MNNRKFLFGVTATDVIVRDDDNNAVVNDVMSHLNGIRRIVMTCYRAGGALTELIIDFGEGQTFCLNGDITVAIATGKSEPLPFFQLSGKKFRSRFINGQAAPQFMAISEQYFLAIFWIAGD